MGASVCFVQDNHSRSSHGVLRGLHYQLKPEPQGKLVRCPVDEIVDVAVDVRRSSATFGQWVGARLSAESHNQLWVPVGFAHGFLTAVDKAESEPELSHAVNGGAPRAFAEVLAETGGRLLQVSTDFVFNGSQGHPYHPEQPRDPLGIYGASKAAGEEAVEHVLGPSGRGLPRDKPGISVVADEVSCPTSTHTLAAACWRAMPLVDTPIELPAVLNWT